MRKAGPVGRDDVLAELRRVVDEAVAGPGHLLLLAGEAGIGKTTMLAAAAGFAESRGVRVAWGWGWPGEGAPGYWPWVQVMRMLGLDIPWPAEDSGQPVRDAPASERFRLFDEVTSLLLAESRIQPLLLLLDDLQWADQPSQLLLDFLARRLPAGAVAVVGGYRDTEPAPGPVLAALAARTTVLPLTGLGPDAVGDLVADVVGEQRAAEVAAGVHRRTGGNPFFVQQVSWLLRSGQEGIPPGVHEAIELRFAALPGAAAAALRTAAVIGQRFSADLAALVSGQPSGAVAEALAAAVRARVVSRDGTDAYRFAHDLFREYAYDQLPAAERASLHRRIGQALEASRAAGGEVTLAELARHFVLADPVSAQAWEYSVTAAREATARLAYEEAVRHWEHAVAATDARPAERTGALLELAEARRRAGQGEAAAQAYLRAGELARNAQDPAALARAALGLHSIGTRTWWPPDQVVALLSEALDAFGPGSGGEPLRLHVMASLSRALAWHGLDPPRARALAAQAVAAARAAGDPVTLASCLLAQHHAIWAAGTARDRLRIAAEVAGLAERSGDQEILLEARLLAATDRLELADPGFRAELDEFIRLAEASRQPRFRYAALVRRAALALLAGRLAEAERLIGQAEMLGEECGEPGVRDVRYDQGWDLLTAQGRLGELGDALPEMFPDPESPQARGRGRSSCSPRGPGPRRPRRSRPCSRPTPGRSRRTASACSAWPTRPSSRSRSAPSRWRSSSTPPCCRSRTRRWSPARRSRSRARWHTTSACSRRCSAGPRRQRATWSGPWRYTTGSTPRPGRCAAGTSWPRCGSVSPGAGPRRCPRWPRWPSRRARSAWPSWPGRPRRPRSPPGRSRSPRGCSPVRARCGPCPTAA